MTTKLIEGKVLAEGLKFAIVASRFNDFIVERLTKGAIDFLVRHGACESDITIVKVPGAFELPQATKLLAESKKFSGIICLGAIIRGATMHFELLAHEVIKSLTQIILAQNVPIGFGVLATDTLEQAIERAGTKVGNKGAEAAAACLEMVQLIKQI